MAPPLLRGAILETDFETNSSKKCKYFRTEPSDGQSDGRRLGSDFFEGISCEEMAKKLLGQILCRKSPTTGRLLKGRIVETEGYLGAEDMACHSYRGKRTARTEPMFMSPGTCYVYFTYGMYYCFNVSSEGDGAVVLIRSLEPLEGEDEMEENRIKRQKSKKRLKRKELCNGPAKLCISLSIDKESINKQHLNHSEVIWLERDDPIDDQQITVSKRIGMNANRAGEWADAPLRFYINNCTYVSLVEKSQRRAALKQ